MMELKRCANCANGQWTNREAQVPEICISCHYRCDGEPSAWKPKVMTNADRIRAMSDKELSEYLVYHNPYHTESNCLKWLKQPVEVDDG